MDDSILMRLVDFGKGFIVHSILCPHDKSSFREELYL
jgi:hypothetical protein